MEGGGSRTAVFSRTGRPPDTGVGGCSLTTCTVGAMLVQCGDAEGVQRVNPNPNQKCEGVQRKGTAAEVRMGGEAQQLVPGDCGRSFSFG